MAVNYKFYLEDEEITDYVNSAIINLSDNEIIDAAELKIKAQIKTEFPNIKAGQYIKIERKFFSTDWIKIFEGQITLQKPEYTYLTFICKGLLNETIKNGRTKSWDMNIDTELGIGSEIVKDILDNSSLPYTPEKGNTMDGSIHFTGSGLNEKIRKFVQNDEDDIQKLNELCDYYNFILRYNYQDDLVEFKSKGFVSYPITLTVGQEITNQIDWKENMEQLCNKVKVIGATVYDKRIETFAGPDSSFELTYTPEDTEVTVGGTLKKRGQKDVGTLGTDFDYYVDVEQKTINFASDVSTVSVTYGAQVPMPVVLSNEESIDAYGGINKIPHFKRLELPDLKDVNDAMAKGLKYLEKFSTPFVQADNVKVLDRVIEEYGQIFPGDLITINDPFTERETTISVLGVEISYPHSADKLTVGDFSWRTETFQSIVSKKINQLYAELNKNVDILIEVVDINNDINLEPRYFKQQIKNIVGDSGVYGHPIYGLYGTAKYGEGTTSAGFILGHAVYGILGTSELGDTASDPLTITIIQGKNTYKELVYDDDFYDEDNSDETTWNTSLKRIEIGPEVFATPAVWYCTTSAITIGVTYTQFTLNLGEVIDTGDGDPVTDYEVYISGDGKKNWQLVEELNVLTNFENYDDTGVYLKINTPEGVPIYIKNLYDDNNKLITPAIYLNLR